MSFKRILSLVLVLCMVLSFFPASAFADNDAAEEEGIEEVVEEPAAAEQSEENNENPPEAAPEEGAGETEEPASSEEEAAAPAVEEAVEEEEEVVEEEVVAEAQTVSEEAMEAGAVCAGDDGNEYLSVQRAVDAAGVTTIEMLQSVELPEPLSITKSIQFLATNYTITGNITINAPEATVKLNGTTFEGTINLVAGTLQIDSEKVKVDAIEASGGTLSISKGTYRTATAKSVNVVGNVTGGTFTEGITDYLCADGYAANASGTVVKTTLKAQIGEGLNRKRFAKFGDAAAAAGESDTVILLASSWTGETPANTFTLGDGKTLVVDKNGYKFGTPKPETAAYMVEESSVGTVFTYKSVLVIATITTGQATPTDVPFASFEGAVAARTDSDTVINLKQNAEYTMTVGDTLKVKLGDKTLAVSAPEGYVIASASGDPGVTVYKVVGVYRVVDMPTATPTDASWTVTGGTDYKDTELDAAVTAAMKKDSKVLVLVGSDASVTFADSDFLNVYAGSKEFTAVAAPGVKPVVGNATTINGVLRYEPTGTYKAKVSAEGKEDQYFDNFISNGALPYANKNGGTVSFLVAPASGQEYTMVADAEKTLAIDWAGYNDEAIAVKAPADFNLKTATEGTVTTYSLTAVVATITNVGNYETFADAAVAAAVDPDNRQILLLADIADPYTMDPKLATTMKVNHNGHSLTVEAPAGWVLRDDDKLVPETRTIGVTNRSGEHTYSITQPFTYTFKPDNGQDDIVRTVYGDTGLTDAPTAEKVGYKGLKWVDENGEYYPATPTDVKPTSDKTYTAEWTAKTYRLIAYKDSVATSTDIHDYTRIVDFGEEITAPPIDPTQPDKTFDYWGYLNKEGLWIGGTTPTYTKVDFPFTLDADALDRLFLEVPDPLQATLGGDAEGAFYFYPIYKDDLYSVSFDGNGGTFVNSETQAIVSSIANTDLKPHTPIAYPKADPVREGYEFLGWLYEGGLLPPASSLPTEMPAEDQNYVAQWEAVNYAINYTDTSDKTLPKSFTVEDLPLTINEISYPGYTFDGWTSTVLGITSPEMVAVIPAGTATATDLKANWTKNEYAIKFDLAGGAFQAGDPVYTSYNVDNAFTIPQPVKDGFTFIGWTGTGLTEPTAVVYIAAGTTGDLEFTANWSVNPVTVLINYNDGGQTKNDKYIVEFGDPINQPTIPAYEGHSLIGWSLTPEGKPGYAVDEFPYVLPEYAESVTLTGQWKTNVHSVTFQAGEGAFPNGSKEAVEPSVAFGTEMNYDTIVSRPERTGYTFAGWVLRDGEKAPATMPDEDLVLYASYVPAEYDVTYSVATNTDAKIINPETGREVDSYTFKLAYGETLPEAPAAVYQGHEYVWVEEYYGYNAPAEMPARNLNFTAEWSGLSYTVKFVANGGTINDMHNDPVEEFYVTGEYGEKFPWDHAFEPTLEGYTFHSWMTEDGTHFDYLPATFPAENTTFTVVWEINKYTVTFNANNGKVVNPATKDEVSYYTVKAVEYGSDVEYPDDPVREGYTFTGWKEQVDGFNIPETMPDRALSFSAQWEADEHSITFNANGGEFYTGGGYVSVDDPYVITKPTNAEITADDYAVGVKLEGYSFVYWAGDDGNIYGGSSGNALPSTMPAEDLEMTAVWQIKKVQVTYVPNGGTAVHPMTYWPSTANFTIEYNYGDELLLPQVSRDGFDFGGWVENTKYAWNYPKTIPDVDSMQFTAVWVGEDFTLTFDANGGLVTTKALSEGVDLAHTDTVPSYTAVVNADPDTLAEAVKKALPIVPTAPATNPVKEGYTFESWIDENDVHWTAADLNSLATDFPYVNKSFKANWTVNKYQVKFDGMGGDLINPNTGLPAPGQEYTQMVEFGTAIPFPADPVREGYTFVGWAETKDGYGYNHPKTMPVPKTDEGLVFTAQWEINQYSFIFDAKGGSFTDEAGQKSDIFVILENYNTPLRNGSTNIKYPPLAVREGYTLKGWNDDEGNVYVSLTDFPATMPAENMIYEAIWEIDSYDAVFDGNGGTVIDRQTGATVTAFRDKFEFGSEIVYPEDPVREGYTFNGWYETVEPYGFNVPETMPAKSLYFYAQWTANKHSITFDANGGTFTDAAGQPYNPFVITEDYGTALTGKYPTVNPVLEGYAMKGWKDADGKVYTTTTEFPTTMPDADLTFTAIWEIQEYIVVFRPGTAGDAATIVNPLDGRATKGAEVQFKVTYGEPIPYAEISASGYDFVGWVEDQLGYNLPETMPARAVGLTAMWKGLDYSITFDANGGLVRTEALSAMPGQTPYHVDVVPSYTAVYNVDDTNIRSLLPLSDPTRAGYTFESWIEKDTGKHWSSEELNTLATKLPYADKTFTANWVAEEHTATFDAGGGIVINPATLVPGNSYTAKFATDAEIIYPDDPTAVGYEFKGWKETKLELGYKLPITMPGADLVFEAQWAPIPNTVVYNANGGTVLNKLGQPVEVLTIEAPTGEAIYVPTVLPVRYGYDLVGWFDHNDNKVLSIDDLAHTMPAEGETYTAMWAAKDINVTFYYDFSGVIYKQNTVKFGDLVTRPVDPIVTGYDFLGWYTYIDGGRYLEEFDFSKPVESEEDIHLVGKWSVSLWTVSFDSNGGRNTIPDQIVEHGKKAAEPTEKMYRNGYTFVGWVERNENGTLADTFYDFNSAVTKDTQLVAIWQGKEVTLRWTDRNVYFVDQKVRVGDFIIRPEFDNYYFQQLIRDGRTDKNGVHYRLDPDNLWDPMPSEKVEEDWGDHFTYMLNWIQQNEVSLYNENGQKTKAFVDDGMTLGEAIDAGLISAPSKPGYKVVWTDESGNPVDESTFITEGMILKASYVPFVPVVTFKVGDSVYKKVEVAYEGTVEKPADPIPTELGVQFAGWVEEGSPVLFDFSTPITDDLTLTAKWAPLVPTEKLVEDFVKRAYNLMLGRDADPDGLKYYVDELTSGRLSGAQMVSNFMNSPEFAEIAKDLSNEEIVAIIYETMLDRIPSAEEAAYHAANLEKGYSYNAITNCFSQSPEFLGICEEAGIEAGTAAEMWRDKNILVTAFVKRNYKLTLLRDAAGEELDYYCEILLQKTLTPQQVAHNFVFSPECVARGLSDQQFITMLYNLYMDRDPDASGLAYYMGLLANGVSREQIDANFGASPEFAEIVKSYGL